MKENNAVINVSPQRERVRNFSMYFIGEGEHQVTHENLVVTFNNKDNALSMHEARILWFLKQASKHQFLQSQLNDNTILFIQSIKHGVLIFIVEGHDLSHLRRIMKRQVKLLQAYTIQEIKQMLNDNLQNLFYHLFMDYLNEGLIFPFMLPSFESEGLEELHLLVESMKDTSDKQGLILLHERIQGYLKNDTALMMKIISLYNLLFRSIELRNLEVSSIIMRLLERLVSLKKESESWFVLLIVKYYHAVVFNLEEETKVLETEFFESKEQVPPLIRILWYRMIAQYHLIQLDLVRSHSILMKAVNEIIARNISLPTEQSFIFFLLGKVNSLLKQFSIAFQYFNLALDFMFLAPQNERQKIQNMYLQELDQSLIESFDGVFYLFNKNYFLEAEHYFLDLLLILFNYGLLSFKFKDPTIRVKLHLLLQAISLKKEEVKGDLSIIDELERYVLLFLEIMALDPNEKQKEWMQLRSKLFQLIQSKYGLRIDLLFIFYNDGRMIYSYVDRDYTLAQSQDELFGGIISAINSVVEELIGEGGIEEIIIGSRILFVSKTENFMLVIFTSNTKERIEPFTKGLLELLESYDPLFTNWYGDQRTVAPLIENVERYLRDELGEKADRRGNSG